MKTGLLVLVIISGNLLVVTNSVPVDTTYAVIGKELKLSFSSPTNRSIDYCQWSIKGNEMSSLTQMNTSLTMREELKNGKCSIMISETKISHITIWQCIVTFSSVQLDESAYSIYFVNVTKAQQPNPPKILNKDNFQTIVASSHTSSVLRNNNTLNLTCCIQNGVPPPTLSFLLDGKEVAQGSKNNESNFCISWLHSFHLDDDRKKVTCQAVHIATNLEDTLQTTDTFQLNILHEPTIIDEGQLEKDIVTKIFSPDETTTFSFNFSSNPEAKVTWSIMDSVTGIMKSIDFDRLLNPEQIVNISFIQEKNIWETKFIIRNIKFVNVKKCYQTEIVNEFGSTWLDFSVTQLAYATTARLETIPKRVDVVDGSLSSVTCCALRMLNNSRLKNKIKLIKENEVVKYGTFGDDTLSPFCYTWGNIRLTIADHSKQFYCSTGNLTMDLSLEIDGKYFSNGAAILNVLSPPRIISIGSKMEGKVLRLATGLNFSTSLQMPFSFDFTANPKPTISRIMLLLDKTNWSYGKTLKDLETVQINHQENNGTVIFKPDSEFIKLLKTSDSVEKSVWISLRNEYGEIEVRFPVAVQPSAANYSHTKTEHLAKSSTFPPTESSSTTNLFRSINSTSGTTTLKSIAVEWSEEMAAYSTQSALATTKVNQIFSLASESDEPGRSKMTFVTSGTDHEYKNPNIPTTNYGTTNYGTTTVPLEIKSTKEMDDFDLRYGIFADYDSDSTETKVSTTKFVSETTEQNYKKLVILSPSRSLKHKCDTLRDTNLTVRYSADASLTTTATWKIRVNNNNYVKVDSNTYRLATENFGNGIWETTLVVPPCNTSSEVSTSNSYFVLQLEDERGDRDELRAILDKSLDLNAASEPQNSAAFNIIIPAVVAVVLILIISVYALMRASAGRCFFQRRSRVWIVDNDVKFSS